MTDLTNSLESFGTAVMGLNKEETVGEELLKATLLLVTEAEYCAKIPIQSLKPLARPLWGTNKSGGRPMFKDSQ